MATSPRGGASSGLSPQRTEWNSTTRVAPGRIALDWPSRQRRDYRLIDCEHRPHPQLDGLYESVEEALNDAIGWLVSMGQGAANSSIGLEVSTPNGTWRTIRQPELLLCPLPSRPQDRSA